MLGGNEPHGFTILETVLFLAISGILFVSVVNLLNGKQTSSYFVQGSHNFESQIQDISTNVETGFFDNSKKFNCTNPGLTGAPVITTGGSTPQGQNYGCTFIGYVMQFNPTDATSPSTQYNVYAVFGREFAPNATTSPTDFQDAEPTAALVTTLTMPPRFTLGGVYFKDSVITGGSSVQDNIVGFFSNFIQTGGISDGSISSQLVPVPYANSTSAVTSSVAQSFIAAMENSSTTEVTLPTPQFSQITPTAINPSSGVDICLKSTDYSNRYAKISIGGNDTVNSGNQLSIQYSTVQGTICN